MKYNICHGEIFALDHIGELVCVFLRNRARKRCSSPTVFQFLSGNESQSKNERNILSTHFHVSKTKVMNKYEKNFALRI